MLTQPTLGREDIVEAGIYLLLAYFSRRGCQLFLPSPLLLYRSLSETENGKLRPKLFGNAYLLEDEPSDEIQLYLKSPSRGAL